VPQLSLFSTEARAERVADLGGLLCGPAQLVRFGANVTARLSMVLPLPERATALAAACAEYGIDIELLATPTGATALRTAFRHDLVPLADSWTHGAIKAPPASFQLDGAMLRFWSLATGRSEHAGYALGLDPHAAHTHAPLAAALARLGLQTSLCGVRAGGPALRITGAKRLRRLAELVGPAPADIDEADWPGHKE
jgi:hypothetical protein